MKISRINDNLHSYQVEHARLAKQREQEYVQMLERRKLEEKHRETRIQRARRLQLDKGRIIDIDC